MISIPAGVALILLGIFLIFLSNPVNADFFIQIIGKSPLQAEMRKSTKYFLFLVGFFCFLLGLFFILGDANILRFDNNRTLPTTETIQSFETPMTNILLCKDTSNMVGNTVECMIPKAYCSYQSTTTGKPTFCNDAPFPNHSFSLVKWGENWSNYDGECIIVSGIVSKYQGKLEIEVMDRSQISSCP